MTNALAIGYANNISPPDDSWDYFVDECRREVMEAAVAGDPLRCNGYVLDTDDFGIFVSERQEFAEKAHAFTVGKLSADDYRKWHSEQLEAYADRHAIARAEWRAM